MIFPFDCHSSPREPEPQACLRFRSQDSIPFTLLLIISFSPNRSILFSLYESICAQRVFSLSRYLTSKLSGKPEIEMPLCLVSRGNCRQNRWIFLLLWPICDSVFYSLLILRLEALFSQSKRSSILIHKERTTAHDIVAPSSLSKTPTKVPPRVAPFNLNEILDSFIGGEVQSKLVSYTQKAAYCIVW